VLSRDVPSAENPVRVLIVHPRDPAAPSIGGIQTFLRDFTKYAPDDFEITFVGTTRDTRARPVGKWLTLDLHGHPVRFLAVAPSGSTPRSPVAIARTLIGLARMFRALSLPGRILQVHRPYRRFVLSRHPGRSVQFIHVDIRDWPGPKAWPRLRALYREFADATLELFDRVFIVNETGADILRTERPVIADRVEFLPVWYDAEVFRAAGGPTRARLRKELVERVGVARSEATRNKFVLLAVRLTDIKKPLLAVEALAALVGRGRSDAQLVVAGSGELLDSMRKRAALLNVQDRVHFLGDVPREDLAHLMQASDALLLTARSEGGGPRVVLEALACGLPVVSTTVVEVKRTVTSGVNGWLVNEPSAEQLADGLAWALDQPRETVSAAAKDAVRAFTAQRMLSGLYDTYRALAADGAREVESELAAEQTTR
jgi:glycosyltransferase involved in cell wall biosynthesis